MIVLLAAGVGVSVLGLLAIGFGIPIHDSSFGNALLIAGVVILCTGFILIGMWFVGRELVGIAKLLAQGARAAPPDMLSIRPSSATSASLVPPVSEPTFAPVPTAPRDEAPDQGVPPPWADEAAARAKGRAVAPEIPPVAVEPVEAPPLPPAAPDRPARRNLLFATRRRDKPEQSPEASLPKPALEAEPSMSFDSAWPTSSKPANGKEAPAVSASDAAAVQPARAEPAAAPAADVTVLKSGVVDGMAYTLYSDGSIEAQMAGEGLVRFASLEALRTYLDQRQ